MAEDERSHATTKEERELAELLADIREHPTLDKEVIGRVIEPAMDRALQYIVHLDEEETSAEKRLHLFCGRAPALVREIATFLLRFHAYEASNTAGWLDRVWQAIRSCYDCSRGHEVAKQTARLTYLSAYPASKLEGFMSTIDTWERGQILSEYSASGFRPTMPADPRQIQTVSPNLLYHSLVNINLLKTPRDANGDPSEELSIATLLRKFPPRSVITEFPSEPPLPGLLLLYFHEEESLRSWAQKQMSKSIISVADVDGPCASALQVIAQCLEGNVDNGWREASSGFFASSPTELWRSLYSLLRKFSIDGLRALMRIRKHEWLHLLTRHLHDNDSHFPSVLQCFVYVLKEVQSDFWISETPDFADVVYDSVKDNPAFSRLLEAEAHIENPWFLTCFRILLQSIWDLPVFDSVLAKVINFMGEELQHPRFQPPCRALVMQVVLSTMAFVHNAAQNGNGKDTGTDGEDLGPNDESPSQQIEKRNRAKRKEAISQVFAIQGDNIASVAFSRQYQDSVWSRARTQAVSLLKDVFDTDVLTLDQATVRMCGIRERVLKKDRKATAEVDLTAVVQELNEVRHIVLYPALWEAVRKALPLSDPQSIAFLIHSVAPSLHLGLDPEHAFHERELLDDAVLKKTYRNAVERINAGLGAVRKDFGNILSAFAEASTSDAILDLLTSSEFDQDILRLILCPLEDISIAAQDIVTTASFAPERIEVFRFLLTNSPEATMDGITSYIQTFNLCAPVFPEVCSMARWMVRCLADVVEALCDPMSGVLRQDSVVNNKKMPRRIYSLWHGMCRASAAIFKYTPSWSRFYATNIMTDWMRDALIFVRDLVKNLQVFESAMQGSSKQDVDGPSPVKITLSNVGKKSAKHLHEVLINLVGWLRLTDAETLHQSTELICELLKMYRRTRVDPPREAIDTIERYTTGQKSQGRLTRDQLSSLGDAIGPFTVIEIADEDEEEEVAVVKDARPKVSEPGPPTPTVTSSKEVGARKQMDIFKQIQPPKVHGFKSGAVQSDLIRAPFVSAASIRERSVPKKATGHAAPLKPSGLMGQLRQDFRRDRQGIVTTLQPKRHEPKNEGGRQVKVTGESESSAEEASSDNEHGMADLSRMQSTNIKPFRPLASKPPPKPERRQVQVLDSVPNTAYNPVLERVRQREEQARRQRRLKPDLGSFTRQVLLWNYEEPTEIPPYPPDKRPKLSPVPWTFESYDDYRRTFEPLIMYECWAGIVKSKEEPVQDVVLCDIGSRSNTDDWLDLDVGINTDNVRATWFLTDTDVVLLRQHNGTKSIMAKVESFRRTGRGLEARFRCCLGNDPRGLNAALQIRTQWKAHKVFSFTTIYREYAALQALSLYDLCSDVLKPKPARLPKLTDHEIKAAMEAYQVNEPQANAILGALRTDGFALIQGPPGTGKTKTICGLVGHWLSKRATALNPGRPQEKPIKPKLLICAPSNAAIDEVAKRLMDGVRTFSGQRAALKVVRVGADAVINVSVKDVSLDELIDRKINSDPSLRVDKSEVQADIAALRRDITAIQADLSSKRTELSNVKDNSARTMALEAEIRALNQKRMGLTTKLNQTRDKQKDATRTMDAARRRFKQEVLDEADVICCTLSGAGNDNLIAYDFETVIIDEAAQSVEVSSLIPLKYQCKRCILVGDPEQLPPTVLSQMAEQQGYSRSLFVRIMHRRPDAVHLLSIQYRMHPEISALDSRMFYNSKLKDGPDMAKQTAQPWHTDPLFGPYRFFDVDGRETKARAGHSLVNEMEADIILALFSRLRTQFPSINFDYRVGIVTMYREQMFKLRRVFREKYGEQILTAVDFNTVDGFQGQEKDIIILSCVRAGPNQGSVGFLADKRRTNVAITRARSSLFIFGNAPTLERSDAIWKSIVQDARERGLLMKVNLSTFQQHHPPVPVPVPAKKAPTPRKPKAEAAQPPLPELRTPQEIAKSKRDGNRNHSASMANESRASTREEGEITEPRSPTLKRKSSGEHERRPPPALRKGEQSRQDQSSRSRPDRSPDSNKKNGNSTGSSDRGTNRDRDKPNGSSRPPNNSNQNQNRDNRGGGRRDDRRNGYSSSWQDKKRERPPPPPPTLGNPISVPSNNPGPPPRPTQGGTRPPGPLRPAQKLPPRGDGTTSETMFIPRKRPNNPNSNPPNNDRTNVKRRLHEEIRQANP